MTVKSQSMFFYSHRIASHKFPHHEIMKAKSHRIDANKRTPSMCLDVFLNVKRDIYFLDKKQM